MKKNIGETYFEEPVTRSKRMIVYTLLTLLILVVAYCVWSVHNANKLIYFVLLAAVIIPALWLVPLRVGVRDSEFFVRRLVCTKAIPLDRIRDVRVFETSMSDGRICGMNGVMGSVGWYKSWEIGLYFAYIGNYSETFLIELKPDQKGRVWKYVVSCRNHREVVERLRESVGLDSVR